MCCIRAAVRRCLACKPISYALKLTYASRLGLCRLGLYWPEGCGLGRGLDCESVTPGIALMALSLALDCVVSGLTQRVSLWCWEKQGKALCTHGLGDISHLRFC